MGAHVGNDPEDLVNSKAIVIWGRDPCKSSVHLLPFLAKARRQGACIVLIDPIRTRTAGMADQHVAPRPGSDGYLAIGVAKQLVEMGLLDSEFIANHTEGYDRYLSLLDSFSMEEISRRCDVGGAVIGELARMYGGRKPSSIVLGWGINKWVHSPEMIRLIDALGAMTGNIGISGGGVNIGYLFRRHVDPEVLAPAFVRYKREIPEPLLGQGILEAKDPPIKMMWINGTNPVVSCPNSNKVVRALRSLDFIIVVDHFMTDTADLAHIFLPATTFVEEEDIVISWGQNWIGPVNQAIEPLGEARSDLRIAQDLSTRLGIGREMEGTTREWLKRVFKPMERIGLTVELVMEGPVRCPIAPEVAFQDRRFFTPSGRFEFIDRFHPDGERKHPFHLLTVLGEKWLNSLILEEDHPAMPKVFVHPSLAEERGIRDRSRALLESTVGQLVVEVQLSDRTRKDTILMVHGTWVKRGGAANQLTEDLISTSGNMAGYHSSTASIEPVDA